MNKHIPIITIITCMALISCSRNTYDQEKVNNSNNLFSESNESIIKATPSDTPLTICVDSENEAMITQVAKMWEALNPGVSTNLVVIPEDTEKAESILTDLRTQIMAGSGPDCFFLRTDHNYGSAITVLFKDPEKAMNSDVFLALDKYINNAQFIDMSNYNKIVMDAGKTSENRFILPYAYEYMFLAYDLCDDALPLNTFDIRYTLKEFHSFRLFGNIIDYENNTLNISTEDIIDTADYYEKMCNDLIKLSDNQLIDPILYEPISTLNWSKLSAYSKDTLKKDYSFFPITNTDGGLTANITLYSAINRYSKQPDNAFSFIDFLYSDVVLNGSNKLSNLDGTELTIQYPILFGISVDNDTFKESIKNLSNQDKDEVYQLSEKINHVRFYTSEDRTLNEHLTKILSTDDESKRREIADQLYDDLWMQVSE